MNEIDETSAVCISNVTNQDLAPFYKRFSKVIPLNSQTPLPIKNLYQTPETLGSDRIAGAAGAYALFPNRNILIVDAGTAIKYDFINLRGEYLGGSIAPGLDLKFKALHHFTGKLPLLEKNHQFEMSGSSTTHAIISGVMYGTLLEIQGFIDGYQKQNGEIQVIITGGDHSYFADRLKGTIFAEPNLVLKGLYEILKYNVHPTQAD